jgi:hypothetical protein
MQTSSKVSSVKKVGILAGLFQALLDSKAITETYETAGGRGHYFDGNGAAGYNFRSSQHKRRKMERRRG